MLTRNQTFRLVGVTAVVVVAFVVGFLIFLPSSPASIGSRSSIANNNSATFSSARAMADLSESIPARDVDVGNGLYPSVTGSPATESSEFDLSSVPSDLAGDEDLLADISPEESEPSFALSPQSAPVVQPVAVLDDAETRTAAMLEKEGIKLVNAAWLYDSTTYEWHGVIIDVGAKSSFLGSHIVGAINIPENRVADLAPIVLPDKHTTIVVYCGSRNCTASMAAARAFRHAGYTDVSEFWGGLKDWVAMGFPTNGIEVAGK